jgi:hypothetical protein
MSLASKTVLQIVPHLPGTFDGVGDYALNLAKALSADHGINTTFLVAAQTSVTSKEGYTVISGLDPHAAAALAQKCEHVILHYVNYGYQARGVPFSLRAFAKQLRSQLRGRWVTMFHELYASGPPWKSAFWLRPLQVRIARDLIDASTACLVSNTPIKAAIHAYDARKRVYHVPVLSNFGEPELIEFEASSPTRWAICGGTALIARSLARFEQLHQLIPEDFAPQHLDVVGGHEEASTRAALERLSRSRTGFSYEYHPEVKAELASEILRQSSFGFFDYFGAGKMWPGMILKSSAFAALCAHGIVPILSHCDAPIAVGGDALPGPFYLTPASINFPLPDQLRKTQRDVYAWYHAHADSRQLARVYVEALT